MTRLRRSEIAAAAAMSCETAYKIAEVYMANGNVFLGISPATANYWYGKAAGIVAGACR